MCCVYTVPKSIKESLSDLQFKLCRLHNAYPSASWTFNFLNSEGWPVIKSWSWAEFWLLYCTLTTAPQGSSVLSSHEQRISAGVGREVVNSMEELIQWVAYFLPLSVISRSLVCTVWLTCTHDQMIIHSKHTKVYIFPCRDIMSCEENITRHCLAWEQFIHLTQHYLPWLAVHLPSTSSRGFSYHLPLYTVTSGTGPRTIHIQTCILSLKRDPPSSCS